MLCSSEKPNAACRGLAYRTAVTLPHGTASGAASLRRTPALVTPVGNYLALHGEQGNFPTLFPNHGLGNSALRDRLPAFEPIVDGTL